MTNSISLETEKASNIRKGYTKATFQVSSTQSKSVVLFIKRNVPGMKDVWYEFNRAKRRKSTFEEQEDGSVKLSEAATSRPTLNKYNASDFINHFMRRNKSLLQNDNWWLKKVIKKEKQDKKYNKGFFK